MGKRNDKRNEEHEGEKSDRMGNGGVKYYKGYFSLFSLLVGTKNNFAWTIIVDSCYLHPKYTLVPLSTSQLSIILFFLRSTLLLFYGNIFPKLNIPISKMYL